MYLLDTYNIRNCLTNRESGVPILLMSQCDLKIKKITASICMGIGEILFKSVIFFFLVHRFFTTTKKKSLFNLCFFNQIFLFHVCWFEDLVQVRPDLNMRLVLGIWIILWRFCEGFCYFVLPEVYFSIFHLLLVLIKSQ